MISLQTLPCEPGSEAFSSTLSAEPRWAFGGDRGGKDEAGLCLAGACSLVTGTPLLPVVSAVNRQRPKTWRGTRTGRCMIPPKRGAFTVEGVM